MAKRCRFLAGGSSLATGKLCGAPGQRVLVTVLEGFQANGPVLRPAQAAVAVTLCQTHQGVFG